MAEEKPADLGTPAVYAIYVDDDDTPLVLSAISPSSILGSIANPYSKRWG